MWSVTSRFLESLGRPQKRVTEVTVTVPGGDPLTLQLKSGSVSVDQAARVRRKATLEVIGSPSDYAAICTDGALIEASHGLWYGNESETVPVFAGELIDGTQQLGDGTISFACADLWTWIMRCRFVTPYSPTSSLTRRAVIAAVVLAARPGTTITDTATDTGTVGTAVWEDSRGDCIIDLATAGLMEAFFAPDGSFIIRDQATLTSSPVWSITSGQGGTLKSASRRRPKNRLYNSVQVKPSAADGSQTWAAQTATITDTASPRHPNYIGLSTYKYANPTIPTAAAALAVATRKLALFEGDSETLSLGAVSNPALEGGDVVRVVTPTINEEPAQIFQHFLDSFSIDLSTGDMRAETRSQVVTDG